MTAPHRATGGRTGLRSDGLTLLSSGARRTVTLPLPSARAVGAAALQAVTAAGVALVAFAAFQLWATDLTQQRAQRDLAREFTDRVARAKVLSTSGTAEEVATLSRPLVGEPVAVLRVPRIGLEQVVVEGSGAEQLQAGPGHLRSTPLPGSRGNAVVLGHRTTYGEPFGRLASLRPGDVVDVATPLAHFTFRVKSTRRVAPGRPDPVTAEGGRAITLVTSDPPHRARGRLVVVAEAPGTVRLADGGGADRPTVVSAHERGLRPDPAAYWPAAIWGLVLAGAYALHRLLRRRWARNTAWLVSSPVLLALAFVWFEQLNRLLPSTL